MQMWAEFRCCCCFFRTQGKKGSKKLTFWLLHCLSECQLFKCSLLSGSAVKRFIEHRDSMFAGILWKKKGFLKLIVFLGFAVVADLQCILQGSFCLFPVCLKQSCVLHILYYCCIPKASWRLLNIHKLSLVYWHTASVKTAPFKYFSTKLAQVTLSIFKTSSNLVITVTPKEV